MIRLSLAFAASLSVLSGWAPWAGQAAPPIEWRLNADADGNGVADGWTTTNVSGQAAFHLGGGGQQVAGACADDRLERTAGALDREAVYLLTAAVTVTRGGLLWGADGFPRKYVAAYSRPVESRTTCRGCDSLTIAFSGLEAGSDFTVAGVRLEKVEKSPLPLEADTGRFLVPRPRTVRYQPGETAGCELAADTPVLLAGLQESDVSLEVVREDLGFRGAAKVVADGERGGVPALVVGTVPGLQARAKALPAALAAAALGCPAQLPEEGCYLAVVPEGVVVVGGSAAGAQHGLQTLRQLCVRTDAGRVRVPKLTIEDAPAMPFRGTYQGGVTANPDRLARAKYYARLKLNAVVMEDALLYHLREGDNLQRVREYFAYLRSLHLEPIPLVQSFGWGMYLLAIDPQCVEGRWISDRPMRFATRAQVAPEARESVPDDGREYLVSLDALTQLGAVLRNASFEQMAESRAEAWQAARWAEAEGAAVVATHSLAGRRCLRLSRQTRGQMRAWQDFEVPPDRALQFVANLKLDNITGQGAYAELYRLDEQGELVGTPAARSKWIAGTRDWAPLRLNLDTGDCRRYRLYLRIQDGTGTAWFDDLRVTHGGTQLRNLVHTDQSLRVTDVDGAPLEAGRDYELRPGETRFPFTDEAAPWRLVRLSQGRIPAGGDVRLSYEYAPVGSVTYCPSNPRTQEIMREALGTVIRELGVKRVHIGHDEPRWLNTCRLCRERKLTNAQLFADEITRMHGFARASDPQVRVMMWADALNPFHNAPAQELEPANDTAPKDLIQCTWFYDARDDIVEARSLEYFAARGYETTGSPWYNLENNWDWAQECARSREATGKCLGMMYTSWTDNPNEDPWAGLPVSAAFAWNPDDPPALEMLPWSPAEHHRAWGVLPQR